MNHASRMDRRAFLKRAALSGVAAATAPMILPRQVLGVNGQAGANERITIGLIGAGNQGTALLNWFSQHCNVAAIADAYFPRAQEVAESVGAPNAYQDYRALLDQDDIDAVIIATPMHWHALNSIHAAQAGKDIYCEKPLTLSIAEGRYVVDAVRKYNCVFQTGSQQRSGQHEYVGLSHVRNGALGKIHKVIASNYRSPQETGHPAEPIPDGLDWDRWCGPAAMPPYNFVIWDNRSDPSWSGIRLFSGGDMVDWGAHGLDMAQWGLGMDDSGPEAVWVEGDPFVPMISTPEHPGGRRGGPDSPKVYMKYPGDIVMEFDDAHVSGVRFIGEHGAIEVVRDAFRANPAELAEELLEAPEATLYRGYEYAVETNHYQDWLHCIKERRDPVAPVEAGHRTATVCHLGNIARWVSEITGETGQELLWDAATEQFTNSPEANRFVNPERRPGYELPEIL